MPLTPVSSGDPHVSAHNSERDASNANEIAIQTKITKPGTPQVGDLLRFNGTTWVSSITRLFEGVGQPEGVVAAPIGSRYVDTTASKGAVEWLKISGINVNDNTGWLLLFGDTGWRNISAMVDKRGSAIVNSALLRRVGDVVDLYLDLKTPTNITSPWTVLTLPSGFLPGFSRYGALQDNNEVAATSTLLSSAGAVNLYGIVASKTDRFSGLWTTKNPWPAVLPGVAA
jgi:hypothetical protein